MQYMFVVFLKNTLYALFLCIMVLASSSNLSYFSKKIKLKISTRPYYLDISESNDLLDPLVASWPAYIALIKQGRCRLIVALSSSVQKMFETWGIEPQSNILSVKFFSSCKKGFPFESVSVLLIFFPKNIMMYNKSSSL